MGHGARRPVIAFGVFGFRPRTEAQPASAQGAASAKYTVVDTEGTNLLVVDNATSTLYFYTVEPGKEVGDDLHLRGSLDLGAWDCVRAHNAIHFRADLAAKSRGRI
jgi:hypothetical protein